MKIRILYLDSVFQILVSKISNISEQASVPSLEKVVTFSSIFSSEIEEPYTIMTN